MRAIFLQTYDNIRSSYWFIPSVMAAVAVLLAIVLVYLDATLSSDTLRKVPFVVASQPDGARTLLGAISSSMIGVAGTVFSVTMVAVVYASGNYGPRLLTNFLSDRGNQLTLGTFIATFVYCMLVLRTVRSADESAATAVFVPHLAVLAAIVLAMCSIAVLIFFIHHVPANIHISTVIDGVGRALLQDLDKRFPERVGAGTDGDSAARPMLPLVPPPFQPDADPAPADPDFAEVEADSTGYLQIIDDETLISAAEKYDLVVRLNCRPGVFVHTGRVLLEAYPKSRLTPEAAEDLRRAFATGTRRTAAQDLLFLLDELVEIAARALSPGVNDPFTAVNCIDWMGAAMSELAGRPMPSPMRLDGEGRLRVIASPVSFKGYLDHSFGNLLPYAATDAIASTQFLQALSRIACSCDAEDELVDLREMARQLLELAEEALTGTSLARVRDEEKAFLAILNAPRLRRSPQPEAEGRRVPIQTRQRDFS